MAIDMVALRAKLAALKNTLPAKENENAGAQKEVERQEVTGSVGTNDSGGVLTVLPAVSGNIKTDVAVVSNVISADSSVPAVVEFSNTQVLGTAKTTEIDHLDFLSKMNALQAAIHKQHPTMPVLLMQIHKQLRADPELTSTLSEEAIGVIVKGLQLQTKTELVSVVVKESKSKKNKTVLTADMF
jgi:hypothetical protein